MPRPPRPRARSSLPCLRPSLRDRNHVGRLRALRPLARLVLDLRALSERLEARARDLRMMDEQILAALFGGDEPVALRVVEPLHSASCHRKNTSLTKYFERVGKCTHNRYSLSFSRTRRSVPRSAPHRASRSRAKRLDLAVHREPAERLRLDLAHAFAREPEAPADLVKRLRIVVAVHAVAQPEDVLLAFRQLAHRAPERLLGEADVELLLEVVLRRCDDIAERRVAVVAQRLVEARHRARPLAHLPHLLDRELRALRDLLVGRLALELRDELALGARDLRLALEDVHRDADRPGLVRDAALHRLPDPPRRVCRELVAAAPVELLDRADEADDPFLDQVEERQPVSLVLLGDRDDEAQVRVHHQVLRRLVAALDALRERDLLICSKQLVSASLVEEELQRVCRRGH